MRIGKGLNAFGAQRLRQQFATEFFGLVELHGFQVVADFGACAPGAHKAEPRGIGRGIGGSDHLHHVPIFEGRAQRHLLAIDARCHGAVADIAVDGIGKVHHGGAARQRHDLALGREHIDRIGEEVHLDVLPKLSRVPGFILDVQQRLQPLCAQAVVGLVLRVVDLVEPMRSDAGLGHHMHGLGAHLKLHIDAGRAHQRGVQRLVAVDLGDGDMVFEFARHRLVELVQQSQGRVAVGDLRHQHPKAIHIGHLGKAQVLVVHLAVNGVQRLFPSGNAHRHAMGCKSGFHLFFDLLQQIAASAARFLDRFGQNGIAPRQQVAKRQVLQLAVGLVQAQAVCDRAVNVQGLLGDSAPLGARHIAHGAHIVGAVGQLDQNDPHVPRHGQQHLAKRLRLVFFAGVERELVELGQSIHQLGHGRAELLDQFDLGDAAVLHGVVHQRRHQGLRVEFPFSALAGDGNGVGNVRVAAAAQLPQMRFVRKAVSQTHLRNLCFAEIVQFPQQPGKSCCGAQNRLHRLRK